MERKRPPPPRGWEAAQEQQEMAKLAERVTTFSKHFADLENSLASLLHKILFFHEPHYESRVAHAIYFSPEGFGLRRKLVNDAVTEWFTEHPIGSYDYLDLWKAINTKLGTIKKTRDLLAHGSIEGLIIREAYYVRFVPPTFMPRLADLVADGTIPGKSVGDMERDLEGLRAAILCIDDLAWVIEYFDQDEPTLRERYDGLVFRLNQLRSCFPDAQNPQGPQDRP